MKKICSIDAKKAAKKGGVVSKSTYDSKARKRPKDTNKAFSDTKNFVSTNCNGNSKKMDETIDAICEIIDQYTGFSDGLRAKSVIRT